MATSAPGPAPTSPVSAAPSVQAPVTRSDRIRGLAEAWGTVVVALLVFLFCAASSEVFLQPANLRNILVQVTVVGVAAIGATIVLLAGAIDLSVGGVVLMGAVVIGDLSVRQGLPMPVAVLVGLAASTAMGVLSGVLVAVVRVEAILATLGTLLLSAGAAKLLLGTGWIMVDDELFASLARDPVVLNLPGMVVIMVLLYLLAGQLMQRSTFGRRVYAVGNNPRAAVIAGVPRGRILIGAFALAGLFSGIAGALMVVQLGIISSGDAVGLEFQAITAALIGGLSVSRGGVGRIEKTLIGALIVGMVTNWQTLHGVAPEFQDAVLGFILLAAVVVDRLIRGTRA